MSDQDLNTVEEVTVLDEADATSNMATIASKPTNISRSDLIAKMVDYASKCDKGELADLISRIGTAEYNPNNTTPEQRYAANKAAQNAVGDNSAKNKATINSSNAAPAQPMPSVKEDLDLVFGDSTDLSEDFRLKVETLFEAAVSTRVNIEVVRLQEELEQTQSSLEEQFAADLEESVNDIKTEMLENVDNYLNYAVAEWISENKLAITSDIRASIAESFISSLKTVFEEHYINIPEDKVDVVESMAAELEEVKSRLNETTEKNIELMKSVTAKEVSEITSNFAEGMSDTQKDKFVKLTEALDYSSTEEFRKKVSIIKESYFQTKSEVKVAEDQLLSESVDEPEQKATTIDPVMNNYVSSISKILKK
jgi:hypothetical protein